MLKNKGGVSMLKDYLLKNKKRGGVSMLKDYLLKKVSKDGWFPRETARALKKLGYELLWCFPGEWFIPEEVRAEYGKTIVTCIEQVDNGPYEENGTVYRDMVEVVSDIVVIR